MRGVNYLAGFGTVILFIGYYCFKAAFQKKSSMHSASTKISTKAVLIISGILSIALGIFLLVEAILNI